MMSNASAEELPQYSFDLWVMDKGARARACVELRAVFDGTLVLATHSLTHSRQGDGAAQLRFRTACCEYRTALCAYCEWGDQTLLQCG